ncbi:substrate-binding periplasmic protein [Rhizobium puerariae]|uniref:Substrate-binding periplasmic protein n=1 Tax=Rhizobium puerariae TaxID=1585791 RepID=A0ABV6ACM6_9HYPH
MSKLFALLKSVFVCGLAVLALGASAYAQQGDSILRQISDRGTLRVGWTVNYPASYRDPASGKVAGYAIDVFNDLGAQLGVKVEYVEDSVATMAAGLQSKKFDVTIPLAITLPRLQALSFSKPFIKSPAALVVRAEDAKKYAGWQDLDKPELTISTTLGSNIDMFVTAVFKNAKIIRVKNQTDSVAQVIAGKADAWANSTSALTDVVGKRPELVLLPNSEYGASPLALPIVQGDFIWAAYLDEFLRVEKENGKLAAAIKKYGYAEDVLYD